MRTLPYILLIGVLLSVLPMENGYSQSRSQYALIQKRVYDSPETWVLNQSVTSSELGINLFSYPRSGVFVFDMNTADYSLRSTFLGVIDPNWNRLVYSAMDANQIKALGSFGTGTNQFRWPKSIAAHAISDGATSDGFYEIYIADTYNDRICRATYTPMSLPWLGDAVVSSTTITGNGLYCPIDVAIYNGGTYRPNTDDEIWVLNSDNTLLNFTYDGSFIRSIDLPEDCYATSLIHSMYGGRRLYVADTANDKIYQYDYVTTLDTYVRHVAEGLTTNAIVDLQLDPQGYLWALDSTSRITKYDDYDLTPICYYYEGDQFETTSGFSIALGAVGSPDMYISESWTPSSGIQHYVIGADILDLQITSSNPGCQHQISYLAADGAIIDAAIYEYNNFDAKVKSLVASEFRNAGHIAHVWDGTDDTNEHMPTGLYSYRVTATSVYVGAQTGIPVNEVTEKGDIYHVYCPRIGVDTLMVQDITGRLPTYCAYVGSGWWKAWIVARDQWYDSALTYTWLSEYCNFAADTADTGFHDGLLITQQDSVFLTFARSPNKAATDDTLPSGAAFVVMFADTDRPDTIQPGHTWDPPGTGYQFIDTFPFYGVMIHEDSCATSCIYCPPCCINMRGNVNMDPNDDCDVADLAALTNHLFITFDPLPCVEEADVNADGIVDITDQSRLTDHLFVTFEPLEYCPGFTATTKTKGKGEAR